MYKLHASLLEHHLIVLRMIGEWWELELVGQDKEACAQQLSERLQQLDLAQELQFIEPEEAAAMRLLAEAGGRLPVATFRREFGEVRQMGPGKLEREEPWYAPTSPAEGLWYRGLLYRAFDETDDGLIEYYFVPDELLVKIGGTPSSSAPRPSEPHDPDLPTVAESVPQTSAPPSAPTPVEAVSAEPTQFAVARDDAVDDLTTILAHAQRHPLSVEALKALSPFLVDADDTRRNLLVTLAHEMSLLRQTDDGFRPNRSATEWLKLPRLQQLRQLAEAWSSSNFNELRVVPELSCEGTGWQNDPLLARTALLEMLPDNDAWCDVAKLVAAIKQNNADFQRPDGDYDNWYIRDKASGDYLNGFEQWDKIEGRLLSYLLYGPMHWLGLADCAESSIRLAPLTLAWLADRPYEAKESELPLIVQPDGNIIAPKQANRLQRFQLTRVAKPLPLEDGKPYLFRLTPRSLAAAKEAGIEAERVLAFLQKAAGDQPIPASVRRCIQRWGEHGTEGTLEQVVVLRVHDEAVLDTLRKNERTQGFIGESLGDLAVVVRNGKWRELQRVTAQLGLLLDDDGVLSAV